MFERFRIFIVCLIAAGGVLAWGEDAEAAAKSKIVNDFKPVCDSLDLRVLERTGVKSSLKLKAVMKRGNVLDFYFDISLSDIPWHKGDPEWFAKQLKELLPEEYRSYGIGNITAAGTKMKDLTVGGLSFDGRPDDNSYRIKKVPKASQPIVECVDGFDFPDGLQDRHIALWQSHGLYYDNSTRRWKWQRPKLFMTVEDLFTQSFVLPYLVPMLENAGAYVMLPRERDFNTHEIIIDNDPHFQADTDSTLQYNMSASLRTHGVYAENGVWEDAGKGFADANAVYTGTENPFRMGTSRAISCVSSGKTNAARATWSAEVPLAGEYAVYVSYRSLPESSESAHYTVRHAGGETEFIVNQKLGGGTWIYLGTFRFDKEANVILDNVTPQGRKFVRGSKVCADAVKIGGGVGNIARSSVEGQMPETSGKPRFTEAARYWLQWAGADSSIYNQSEDPNDYRDDLMSRGDWVTYMSGGSDVNPLTERGGRIPFDLTLALHSDAGSFPNDSIIGTLSIYSLESDGKKTLPSGESMSTGRDYANIVQSQIVNDLQAVFDPDWNRRGIWNRGYRESRTPSSPTMLCELLSHQNFSDMRYGHDPAFKFCASRAIYKGMLKYLSNRYGRDYVVQPLPVHGFSADLVGNNVVLSWSATEDLLEPTAVTEGFLIQTRMDGGGFDAGFKVDADEARRGTDGAGVRSRKDDSGPASRERDERFSVKIPVTPGHIYSFKVSAYNSGGKSFPSEILSAGVAVRTGAAATDSTVAGDSTVTGGLAAADSIETGALASADSIVLIVNNFDRVSAPVWFDGPERAGFDIKTDAGVPYRSETSFIGQMYGFDRAKPWESNDKPGFGASDNDAVGSVIAGNSFDYPYLHGKAILESGYSFCSVSAEAFAADTTLMTGKWCADIICGKQVSTITGSGYGDVRYTIFPENLRAALTDFTSRGGNLIVSGAYIGTDPWSGIYPVERDSTQRSEEIKFAEKVLGYRWQTGNASNNGQVRVVYNPSAFLYGKLKTLSYNHLPCESMYMVENPDGIGPSDKKSQIFLRYGDTGIAAGIIRDTETYKTVCLGFPLESITDFEAMKSIFSSSFEFFIDNEHETDGNNRAD